MRYNKLSLRDVRRIIELYNGGRGKLVVEIAKEYNLHHTSIVYHLERAKVYVKGLYPKVHVKNVSKKKGPKMYEDYIAADLKRSGNRMSAREFIRKKTKYSSTWI